MTRSSRCLPIVLLAAVGLFAIEGAPLGVARTLRHAQTQAGPVVPDLGCMAAISAAERSHGIPTGLLMAIARVESDRPDPNTRLVQPWPWTINVGGKGFFFETRLQAITYVEDVQRTGTTSVDTGCLQVNLQQHPEAFRSLDEAFDPRFNADYGARFLAELFHKTGDWGVASGYYHSRTLELSLPYRVSVAARFPALQQNAAAAVSRPDPMRPLQLLANAWASTMSMSIGSVSPVASSLVPIKQAPRRRLAETSALVFSAR